MSIEWIDVLVEMLLNLFTINKNWIRNIVKNQFRKLFPKLTFNSVKLIIDVNLAIHFLLFLNKVIPILFILILKLLEPEGENDLLIDEDTMDDQKSDAEKNAMSVDSADEDDESDGDEDSDVDDEEMIHKNK